MAIPNDEVHQPLTTDGGVVETLFFVNKEFKYPSYLADYLEWILKVRVMEKGLWGYVPSHMKFVKLGPDSVCQVWELERTYTYTVPSDHKNRINWEWTMVHSPNTDCGFFETDIFDEGAIPTIVDFADEGPHTQSDSE